MENCVHLKGLRILSGTEYVCPVCRVTSDLAGVEGWVREAERARDESYPLVEGDEFGRIALEERQREVYRRRKLLYAFRDRPGEAAKPEMILVMHDARGGRYECRIFYKEPKPEWCVERLVVEASEAGIQGLKGHPDPVARLVAEKVMEFHEGRSGGPASARRVFYSNEL